MGSGPVAWQDAPVYLRIRPATAFALLMPLAVVSGCQHQVLVRSWPSGADVSVDDSPDLDEENVRRGTPEGTEAARATPSKDGADWEPLGSTPLSWSEEIGPKKPRVLKLTLGDEVREVVVERADYNWPALAAWTAGGAGACVGLTGVGFAAWGIGLGLSNGEFSPFYPGVTVPIGLLACAGGLGAGVLYARQGPAEVMVDFEGANVVSLPPDLARWKGESPAALDVEAFETKRGEAESTRPNAAVGSERPPADNVAPPRPEEDALRPEEPSVPPRPEESDDKLSDGPPLQF